MTDSAAQASSVVSANTETQSSERQAGTTPAVETRPRLGFNPTILSYTYGDTEYGIGALPLGGYVKMAGENPDDPRTGSDDEFLSKSKWQRFQILIMGPAMNLILAVGLLAVVHFGHLL